MRSDCGEPKAKMVSPIFAERAAALRRPYRLKLSDAVVSASAQFIQCCS
jgi:hypothetical protein